MPDISVELMVITKDRLRQISINLVKETNAAGKVSWSMDFALSEKNKKDDPKFEEIIRLKVKIKPSLAAKAEATATDKGLDDAQTSQAFIAGDAAKAAAAKEISEKSAKAAAEKIIAVRSSG